MTIPLPLLVFTDIDGTLVDHDSYRWEAAIPALAALKAIGAGVILASSKTAPEIVALRDALGLARWPAIVENGGGLLEPGETLAGPAARYEALRRVLDDLPADQRAAFRGFGDMSALEIADATDLSLDAAALAADRAFTEPGIWTGSAAARERFLATLSTRGVQAREGGRFLTLSFGGTKADRMAQITGRYDARHTAALGDAPNDVEMLAAAEFGVIIANPHRAPLPRLSGEATGQIIRTTTPGPAGWNQAVLDLIARLKLE